ncbi:hypothetical protein TNCV_2608881 [Trichonephila clavipes]|uniref:Uncharacterized protein n=1 Tax=Trichonephila clavipes TaxID=2585209 RepID=A0A8X6RZK3_TRICX|nr:hypothetical protein TNCV_2608881 [Trichonephila clavipes]
MVHCIRPPLREHLRQETINHRIGRVPSQPSSSGRAQDEIIQRQLTMKRFPFWLGTNTSRIELNEEY